MTARPRVAAAEALPPGQVESDDFPRFGLGGFAFRFPSNPDALAVAIKGDVQCPLSLTREFSSLPRVEQVSDFHCVTTWSTRALRWSGFRFVDFYESIVIPQARPAREAELVVLRAQDGYSQSLPLQDLLADDVLLADRLNGEPLTIAHGAPLRLVAPSHYGYKNVKHLRSIDFCRDSSSYRFAGPSFMDHPRARVAEEERAQIVPAWIIRKVYRATIPPVRWLFRIALERELSRK